MFGLIDEVRLSHVDWNYLKIIWLMSVAACVCVCLSCCVYILIYIYIYVQNIIYIYIIDFSTVTQCTRCVSTSYILDISWYISIYLHGLFSMCFCARSPSVPKSVPKKLDEVRPLLNTLKLHETSTLWLW
jgi:hypothetical protein